MANMNIKDWETRADIADELTSRKVKDQIFNEVHANLCKLDNDITVISNYVLHNLFDIAYLSPLFKAYQVWEKKTYKEIDAIDIQVMLDLGFKASHLAREYCYNLTERTTKEQEEEAYNKFTVAYNEWMNKVDYFKNVNIWDFVPEQYRFLVTVALEGRPFEEVIKDMKDMQENVVSVQQISTPKNNLFVDDYEEQKEDVVEQTQKKETVKQHKAEQTVHQARMTTKKQQIKKEQAEEKKVTFFAKMKTFLMNAVNKAKTIVVNAVKKVVNTVVDTVVELKEKFFAKLKTFLVPKVTQ